MSLAVDVGSHKVEFELVPVGLIPGVMISGVSILFFILFLLKNTR